MSILHQLSFFVLLPILHALEHGNQYVGKEATIKRSEALSANPVNHDFLEGMGNYNHLPYLEFHPAGEMDLCSLRVVGAPSDEDNPFNVRYAWVEDENGEVVYLVTSSPRGGFAVPPHLKLPNSMLTPYAFDDDGLWQGKTVEAPKESTAMREDESKDEGHDEL